MKILFFVSSLNAGGAERVATTLANAWAGRGDAVTLVPTYMTKQRSFYPVDDQVDVLWLTDYGNCGLLRFLPVIGKWLRIRRLIRTTQPDVVVSFLTNVNVNVLVASLGLRVPVIVSERTNPVYSESAGKVLRYLRRLTYRRARYVVMQTQASVKPFTARVPGLQGVAVVPNPLPSELSVDFSSGNEVPEQVPGQMSDAMRSLAELRSVGDDDSGRHNLVAMGRLVAIKQFDVLIDAFAQVVSRHPGWVLTIWGDGPLRSALTEKIAAKGLEDRVILAGRTAQPWHELSAADLFVMTSRVEGFPNVLLEAMALGLPCVALDCPSGPAELTRHGEDARLVPMDQFQALVNALDDLMGDADLRQRLGTRAAQSVRERYGLPVILAQWDALFGK